ncbi:hypothetical protein ACFFRR_009488 [Megaselia abdita]
MNVIVSLVITFLISQTTSETNPTKKECNFIKSKSRLDFVLCTKLMSLSELSELMQPNWVDVAILNRPSFPFVVDYHDARFLNRVLTLNLSRAGHLKISEHGFKDFHSLKSLDASDTKLSTLNPDWFIPRSPLAFLDFSNNELRSLKMNNFKNLLNLRFLNISSNNLDKMDVHAFAALKKLDTLDLSSNNLREINLGHSSSVKTLFIGNNWLGSNKRFQGDATSRKNIFLQQQS